jgi:two-component system nitrate/nitrite response regulator NarL
MNDGRIRIRILVVDDHPLFRRGLIAMLACDERLEVVAEAGDVGQAQRLAELHRPDLILLDNHLPGVNGVNALPALRAALPAIQVLMLTVSEDERDLAAALRGGACGYLLKTADLDELTAAILRAVHGQSSFSPEMTAKLASALRSPAEPAPADPLSAREREIAALIAGGASNKEIARRLDIAETTVKIHVQHILRKLNLSSRVQAAVWMSRQQADR